ncbi:hypothetical protein [Sciscionella marina]|uniref:hypothetical protein n=1 Tax=Sciscionella marina TaxID=508770 RepID=UPI0003680F8C|nr:hypothetical protein [Sciscionella marina]
MSNRKPLLVGAVVVVVVAVAAVVTVVLVNQNSTPAAQPCDIPQSVREQPASAKSAPGGGGIQVEDTGFSQVPQLTAGAVLRNTSDHIAYRTKVAFLPVVSIDGHPPKPLQNSLMTTEIPVLQPGEQIGIGRVLGIGSTWRLTKIDIDLQTTTWLAKGALGRFAQTKDTVTDFTKAGASPPTDVVHYTEKSASCRPLVNRHSSVVYRDASGKIIGGDFAAPDGKGNPGAGNLQPVSSPSCTPGERKTWIVPFTEIPKAADKQRTEVYSYCDLNAPENDINAQFG